MNTADEQSREERERRGKRKLKRGLAPARRGRRKHRAAPRNTSAKEALRDCASTPNEITSESTSKGSGTTTINAALSAVANEQCPQSSTTSDTPPDTPRLLPQHQKLIDGSAIKPTVAAARGYRSIEVKADLRRLGFADYQCRIPALLLPVFSVHGEIATYQLRPDGL